MRETQFDLADLIQAFDERAGEIHGLHLIPHSNPPHYLFVQHTTTDRERLRGEVAHLRICMFAKFVHGEPDRIEVKVQPLDGLAWCVNSKRE